MQVVKNSFLSLFVVWFAILLFMPKEEIYYTLENTLLKQGIEINEESIEEGLLSLRIRNADIYVKGIQIASVEEVTFFTLLFYSRLDLNALKVDKSLQAFVPPDINSTVIMHSLLSPYKAFLTSKGSFGLAEGVVDLKSRDLRIDLTDIKELGAVKSQLKKDDKGWYYETSF